MQTIRNIRLQSQHLVNQKITDIKELVQYMGAIQAQEYTMAKWAIGSRLNTATDKTIEEAFNQGNILRTHVMRPTWHFVANEDIRWMVELSSKRIISACISLGKQWEIPEKQYLKAINVIEKLLEGNNHLTKEEIKKEFEQRNIPSDIPEINRYLMRAEAEGIICSGAVKNKKQTYALIDERAPATNTLTKEEALAKLASRYFLSHSPASMNDFIWWSGLLISEAKQAVKLIEKDLIFEKFEGSELIIHRSVDYQPVLDDSIHFLPSYDEYLISYKNRTNVLDLEHYSKAFNTYGIFYPVLAHNGRIVGNWKKSANKKRLSVDTSLFIEIPDIKEILYEQAHKKYHSFLDKK